MSISIKSLSYKSKLIEIVKQNPDLWLVSKKAPSLKQKLWHEVGKELGTSGLDARRHWEILRDQFRREYKRCRSEKNYESQWIYYNRMLFMRQALRPRDGKTLNSDTDEQQSPLDVSQIVEHNLVTQMEMGLLPKIQVRQDLHGHRESSHMTVYSGEASTSTGVSSSSGKRSRYEESDLTSQRRRRRWRQESSDDEDYHFVMSILPSLQCIQQSKKLRVRSKIMELIATELESSNEENPSLEMSRFQVKFEPEGSDVDEKLFGGDSSSKGNASSD